MHGKLLCGLASGVLAWLLVMASLPGCSDSDEDVVLHPPKVHRAESVTCQDSQPPSDPVPANAAPASTCAKDSDCSAGKNGRCQRKCFFNGHTSCSEEDGKTYVCSYDTCTTDADCSGKACLCGASEGGRNTCGSGACAVDADCGAGGYCSPSERGGLCPSVEGAVGFYCHTNKDLCRDDSDCEGKGEGSATCVFSSGQGRWVCAYSGCVG